MPVYGKMSLDMRPPNWMDRAKQLWKENHEEPEFHGFAAWMLGKQGYNKEFLSNQLGENRDRFDKFIRQMIEVYIIES